MKFDEARRARVRSLLQARSIAVVGASDDRNRIGGRPLAYCIDNGFEGRIYPVNPTRGSVQGLRTWPTLADLPEQVDLAIIAVSGKHVLPAVREGTAKAYVVFSSGFREDGPEGAAAEREVMEAVAAQGAILLGPNCLGLANRATGMVASFAPNFARLERGTPSGIAAITQSGALGSYLHGLAEARGILFEDFIATGNEADVSVVDLLDHYVEREDIMTILTQFEGTDPPALAEVLDRLSAAGKIVLLAKGGRTAAGAVAAASHTGSIAGDDAAFNAILRGRRVIRRESVSELLDLASAAALGATPRGLRLGALSSSGGFGVLIADEATDTGMTLPPPPDAARDLYASTVAFGTPSNPLDMTGQVMANPQLIEGGIAAFLASPRIDAVLCYLGVAPSIPELKPVWLERILAGRRAGPEKPMVLAGLAPQDFQLTLRGVRIPTFDDPVKAVRVLSALAHLPAPAPAETDRWPMAVPMAAAPPPDWDESALKERFRSERLSVPVSALAADPASAVALAEKIGFPVVLKLVAPGLQHKSDIGGVAVGLRSGAELRHAAERMAASTRKVGRAAFRFLVEAMIPPGVELIVSVRQDITYGAQLIVGLGGIHAEVLKDVAIEPLPTTDARLALALQGLKGRALLAGHRGARRRDGDEIVAAIRRIATSAYAILAEGGFAEIELNPVIVNDDGFWIADAVAYPVEQGKPKELTA